jgi:hypothetical protein
MRTGESRKSFFCPHSSVDGFGMNLAVVCQRVAH